MAENYEVFACSPPAIIEGCPCCIASRGVDRLLSKPLRELSGQDLWRYVSGLFYTIGSKRDFRYFLPRILEISITNPRESNDPQIVLAKLALGDWRSWAEREQRAMEEFVEAWFEWALMQDLVSDETLLADHAEAVLCGAARAGFPMSRWFDRLLAPDAAPVLAGMLERYPNDLSSFWDEVPESLRDFSAFLEHSAASGQF